MPAACPAVPRTRRSSRPIWRRCMARGAAGRSTTQAARTCQAKIAAPAAGAS